MSWIKKDTKLASPSFRGLKVIVYKTTRRASRGGPERVACIVAEDQPYAGTRLSIGSEAITDSNPHIKTA
jgi:hypothetical protein